MEPIDFLKASIARIRTKSNTIVGVGFLASQKYLITCAHVVSEALEWNNLDKPKSIIKIDFPLVDYKGNFEARVIHWSPEQDDGSGDIAILQLDTDVPLENPSKLIKDNNLYKHGFRVYGFPPGIGYDPGIWVYGMLRDDNGHDRIQMETLSTTGYSITPGFSGSPVWDDTLEGVVGMVVSADLDTRIRSAFAIMIGGIKKVWPELPVCEVTLLPPQKGSTPIEITFDLVIKGLDFKGAEFELSIRLGLLALKLRIKNEEILVRRVTVGSTKILVELPLVSSMELFKLCRTHDKSLIDMGIIEIRFVSSDKENSVFQIKPVLISKPEVPHIRTSKGLTQRHQRILEYLEERLRKGYPPSIREIGEATAISSTSVVTYYLKQLEEWGYIEREAKFSRALSISGFTDRSIFKIPILGPIAAGLPIQVAPGESYIGDEIDAVDVARSLLPLGEKGTELFALKVKGDSMIDAMVNDGDIVIMKRTEQASNGDMVAIWLPRQDETTLKYFYKEKDRYRLQPANPTMEPIYIERSEPLEIKGKVIFVIRQVKSLVE